MTAEEQTRLNYLRDIFDEAKELNEFSHLEAREAYEYERGNQLPDDVKSILAQRGQPSRWENIYKSISNKIGGMKSMTKQEITAFPRRLVDRDKADTISKTLRAFQDSTEWWTHKSRADRDLRLAGLSIIEVKLKVIDEFDDEGVQLKEIEYLHIPILESYIDMYSNSPDFSDMRYFHHSRLMDSIHLKKLFPNAKLSYSNKYDMIRVTKTWYRYDGEIRCAIWSDTELLEDIQSPYSNLNRFPIAIRKMYYSHRKEYYGMFRDVKPFQDSINNTMLRIINMLGSSKLLVESDAVDNISEFQDHYGLDNSITEVRAGALKENKIKDISQNAPIAQLMNIVQDARARAEQVIGLNSEALGNAVNRMSGYAIENRQNAGLVGLQEFMDISGYLDIDIAEISIKMLEEHFSAEQTLIISDTDGQRRQIFINQYERDNEDKIIYKEGKAVQNRLLGIGRYDLILNKVPFNRGASGERQKNWAEIIKVLQVTNPTYIAPLLPIMLKDVDSPEAEQTKLLIQKLQEQEAKNKQDDSKDKLSETKIQLEMKKLQAQVEQLMSQANLNNAEAKMIESSGVIE
jgi:hypothetical protein